MGTEIERKFLVTGDGWQQGSSQLYRQGYLVAERERSVRIRQTEENALITIKGAIRGATRDEFEYEIPIADAEQLLDTLCIEPLIEKRRYRVDHAGHTWEVDEFFGANQGLVVAELELGCEDEPFEHPPWLGKEVTDDPRYLNVSLQKHPYIDWQDG